MEYFPKETFYSMQEDLADAQLARRLLGRPTVHTDLSEVSALLRDKTVLVTGGAGSIGSELCRRLLSLGCQQVIVYDHWENGLFYLDQKLKPLYRGRYVLINGSVTDPCRLHEIFCRYRPALIFHAAANKHVPLVELNPRQGILTNLLGTIYAARAALEAETERFILISTDKAVNPGSVMGATKRGAELALQLFAGQKQTVFASVRFGNVFGSAGSVATVFARQIRRREPLTITHPAMTRYFMTVSEAVELVLQAGAMAVGGEIFVLDMGEQVSILELARRMVAAAGLEPSKDIAIHFTGVRPGEKLTEELSLAEEHTLPTRREKILLNAPVSLPPNLAELLQELERDIATADLNSLLLLLHRLVPTFNHRR